METVKIVNGLQALYYIKSNIKPVDIFVGYNDKLVYVFDKKESEEVWKKWLNWDFDYSKKQGKYMES